MTIIFLILINLASAVRPIDGVCDVAGTAQDCCNTWLKLIENPKFTADENQIYTCKLKCAMFSSLAPRCTNPKRDATAESCLKFQSRLDAKEKLDEKTLNTCLDSCTAAKSNASATDKQKYTKAYLACSDRLDSLDTDTEVGKSSVDEGNPQPEDPNTGADGDPQPEAPNQDDAPDSTNNDGGTVTKASGDPNRNMLQSLLQGMAMPSSPSAAAKGIPSNVNFATGSNGSGDTYTSAAERIQGGSGEVNTNTVSPNAFNELTRNDRPSPASALVKGDMASGGGGQGAPGGGGGMPQGNGMGAGRGGGSPAAGGGGARTSIAGTQLNKVGQNSFYSGGGSQAGGAKDKRKTAATGKPTRTGSVTPKYISKGDGDSGLNRLFGDTPSSFRSRLGAHSCLDTVFCSMESFFNHVERYPNSDINPTSY